MGTKYTTVAVSGYNATPPSDDGSAVDANKVKWSYSKTKLGDPLNVAIVAIDAALVLSFAQEALIKSTNYTTTAGDNNKLLECTGTITISLLDASTGGAGYQINVINVGVGVVTVGRATVGNTINGVQQNWTLNPGTGASFLVNGTNNGYDALGTSGPADAYVWAGNAGGTANAIALTVAPAIGAYAGGQVFRCRITAANTTAVTVSVSGLATRNLTLRGGGALVANVLQIGDVIDLVYDSVGTQFQIISARPGANYDITALNNATTAPLIASLPALTSAAALASLPALTSAAALASLPALTSAPGIAALPSVTTGSVFRKNCIINGDMRIAQRGTSFVGIADGAYSLDRWIYRKNGVMVHTLTQDTDVPTVAQSGVLFTNSMRLNLTTADTTTPVGKFAFMTQRIEGYNFQRIAQRAFTASFWVKATTTGVYSIAFRNSISDRSYVGNFTISTTATWELKTISVTASPSAGTWNYTTGLGLDVSIVLAVGSTYQTTAGAWQTGNFIGTATNINGVNTGATDFRIVGLQLEAGTVATEFEMLDFQQEIAACQRYYWKSFPIGTTPAQSAGYNGSLVYRASSAGLIPGGVLVQTPVLMRASPTVVYYNPVSANANWRNFSLSADSGATEINFPSDRSYYAGNLQVAGDAVGNSLTIHATADADL